MSDSGRQRSPVAPGDVVGGKYRVERVLGAGGMGVVVAATHVDLGQSVALKFIQTSAIAANGSLERFMREARAAVRLRSEHVCRVLDVGRDGDRPYMVLELLEGMDLAKLAKHHGPLPVADAVEYVVQACDALVEAHGLGIVHRDLKPQNVFVTRRVNGAPLVKVLDFGIAKTVGAAAAGQMALTDSSAIIGSPLYMAPEQMRAPKTVDVRIDIWALGVILYELLGGQLPFDGETVTEVCIKVVNEEPTRLLDLRPGLDRKLVDVVMRCLEKDPEDRWPNVAQLALELEPFSRSGRQGGYARPWRSFEATGDARDATPRVVVPAPGQRGSADETGPSTAITMPSVRGEDVAAALGNGSLAATTPLPGVLPLQASGTPAPASRSGTTPQPAPFATTPLGTTPPVGAIPAPGSDPEPRHPLVSTDTAWGQGTARQAAHPRSRSGASTLLPILAALAVAAAAGGLYLGRKTAASTAAAAAPPPAATVLVAPPTEPSTPAVAPAPATSAVTPPAAEPAADAKPARSIDKPVAAKPGVRVAPTTPAKRAATDAPAPAATSPAPTAPVTAAPKPVEAPKPEPKPAETTAPNGAPILH